jgi:hypothetical protein
MTWVFVAMWMLGVDEWEKVEEADGMTIEVRAVANKKYNEFRASAHSARSVNALCTQAFGDGSLRPGMPQLSFRKVISSTPSERVVYEQTPYFFVRNRDATLLYKRVDDAAGCHIYFETKNDRGPPTNKDFVRSPLIYGAWDFVANEHGGTDASYFAYIDPGAGLMTFFVNSGHRRAAKDWLKFILN